MVKERILYCHCAYAKVIAEQTKTEVLRRLTASGTAFEAVADLCEMSARKDPALRRIASAEGKLEIAACFPRAVKWLFSAADAPLDEERVVVHNMRTESPEETASSLLQNRVGEEFTEDEGKK